MQEDAMADEKKTVEAWHSSLEQLALDGRWEKLAQEAEKMTKDFPDDALAIFRLAYAKSKSGTKQDLKDAIELYTKSIELKPDFSIAFSNRGINKIKIDDFEAAIEDFDEAIKLDDFFATAYSNRGGAKDNLKKYDEAIADYDKAIELDPDNSTYWNNRAGSKYRAGRNNEALDDYKKSIELNKNNANAYANRANLYLQSKQYDKALDDLNKSLELKPLYVNALIGRSEAYFNTGKFTKAIDDLNKALNKEPDNAAAYNNRGNAYHATSEISKAIDDYTSALNIEPDNATTYFNRGVAYIKTQRFEDAIRDFDKSLEYEKEFAETYNYRGIANHEMENYDQALKDLNKAIELEPNYSSAYRNRGRTLHALKQYDEAIDNFNKAVELNPTDELAQQDRGLSLLALNKHDEAFKDFDRAITFAPASDGTKAFLDAIKTQKEISEHSQKITSELNKLIKQKEVEFDKQISEMKQNYENSLERFGPEKIVEFYSKYIAASEKRLYGMEITNFHSEDDNLTQSAWAKINFVYGKLQNKLHQLFWLILILLSTWVCIQLLAGFYDDKRNSRTGDCNFETSDVCTILQYLQQYQWVVIIIILLCSILFFTKKSNGLFNQAKNTASLLRFLLVFIWLGVTAVFFPNWLDEGFKIPDDYRILIYYSTTLLFLSSPLILFYKHVTKQAIEERIILYSLIREMNRLLQWMIQEKESRNSLAVDILNQINKNGTADIAVRMLHPKLDEGRRWSLFGGKVYSELEDSIRDLSDEVKELSKQKARILPKRGD